MVEVLVCLMAPLVLRKVRHNWGHHSWAHHNWAPRMTALRMMVRQWLAEWAVYSRSSPRVECSSSPGVYSNRPVGWYSPVVEWALAAVWVRVVLRLQWP